MKSMQEGTRRIMRGMNLFLGFSELNVAKQKFPETEWKGIARRFIQYVRLAERAIELTPEELNIVREVNDFFAKAKAETEGKDYDSTKKKGAAEFLEAIGAEERKILRSRILSFGNPDSPEYGKGLLELEQMMENAQQLKREERTPKDGDSLSDHAIWGYTQITNPDALIDFLINHALERYLSQIYRDELHIPFTEHKDYLCNMFIDLLAIDVARGDRSLNDDIVKIWMTPKPNGLGWLKQNRIDEYSKRLAPKTKE